MQSSVLDNILSKNTSALPVKDFLQQITKAHPYFTPAQFYLLHQLNIQSKDYAEEASKTALLFNNPHWLQFQLEQMPQQLALKQTPVIAMYAENSDNDDDTAVITTTNAAINTEEIDKIPNETALEAEVNETDAPVRLLDSPLENELKIDLASTLKRAENETDLTFEPMHLVDYFASQGIKLSEEALSTDKLGKQLKSFSDWLKTMKKVHIPEATANAGTSDIVIQTLAAKSNKENEVLTEAMALVFAQQGKSDKAIGLYQKLSLLNPSKSAYFAAKIEQLKEQ